MNPCVWWQSIFHDWIKIFFCLVIISCYSQIRPTMFYTNETYSDDTELVPVFTWGEGCVLLEQASERSRVIVADL